MSKPYNPFDLSERNFAIDVDGFYFQGKFPLPNEETEIDMAVRAALGGVVLETVSSITFGREFMRCTLNRVLTVLPDEFPKKHPAFDWGKDMPDPAFATRVWAAYQEELKKFLERKKNDPPAGAPVNAPDKGESPESVPPQKPGSRARRTDP